MLQLLQYGESDSDSKEDEDERNEENKLHLTPLPKTSTLPTMAICAAPVALPPVNFTLLLLFFLDESNC